MHLKFDTNIFRTLATARFLQQPADADIQIDADRVLCNYSGGFFISEVFVILLVIVHGVNDYGK